MLPFQAYRRYRRLDSPELRDLVDAAILYRGRYEGYIETCSYIDKQIRLVLVVRGWLKVHDFLGWQKRTARVEAGPHDVQVLLEGQPGRSVHVEQLWRTSLKLPQSSF